MIDVEIQKLEMEQLEKEMAKLQGQIQDKKDSINQKLSVDNIDEEKNQIDNVINHLNTVGQ